MINRCSPEGVRAQITKTNISPLELFHPDGSFEHAFTIGENGPERLLPRCDASDNQDAGLILWAPSEAECRELGWLERSASAIGRTVGQDGLVYALIPRTWRSKARQLLVNQGLQPGPYFIHLPNWSSSRYIIPLQEVPARYALLNLFPTRWAIRTLALAVMHLRGGEEFLRALIPWAGFTAQRADSRAPFDWLYRLAEAEQAESSAILSASWRKDRSSFVLHCFSEETGPTAVAKTVWPVSEDFDQGGEFVNLSNLGKTARLAGARVPYPGQQSRVGGHPVYLQSVLDGRSAAAVLKGHPERIRTIVEPVATWLEAWNDSTREFLPLTGDRLERELLAPARRLVWLLPDGNEYVDWLAVRCVTICDAVPFVAAHRDLTLWNILLQPGSPPGIVDWSEASPESLPLTDLFYLIVDAVAVAHQVVRERAFQECFSSQGRYLSLVKQYVGRLRQTISIPKDIIDISLHACVLHHADNEQRGRTPEEPESFLNILRWMVQNRAALERFS